MAVRELCDEFWAWRMHEYPELATTVGYHDYDDIWDDMSESGIERRKEFCLSFLTRLKAATAAAKSKEEKDLGLLLTEEIQIFVDGLRHKGYVFAVNGMEGPQVDHARTIGNMKYETVPDYEKALSRLNSIAGSLQQIESLLAIGIVEKRVPSIVSMTGIEDQFDRLQCAVEDSDFYKPFLSFPDAISEPDRQGLRSRARTAVETIVLPAFAKLSAFIVQTYMPACRKDTIGCIHLPDGERFYQDVLNFHTTTSLTAQEVHDIGLAEVKRIRACMDQIKEEVGFAGSLRDFTNHLRSDEKFRYKSAEQLMTMYQQTCDDIHALLPSIFKTVLDVPCKIIETPAGMNSVAPAAYYLAASEDGSRPGTFYINTFDLNGRMMYERVSLCLHECEPGHHYQSVYAMQQGAMPGFRRHVEDRLYYQAPGRFALHTAYMEGWGLYCESLGHDLGLYNDPYMRFGSYSMEILRACRLVVDTGMHVLGWTRQQAIDFLAENSALSIHNVTTEVDRFITWPGQACAYKIGELEIQKLRQEAKSRLGSQFDLCDFHEVFLSCGAVPIKFFRDAVHKYIDDKLQ